MKTGIAYNETAARISLARMVNQVCGAPIVTPWTVYELSDDWLDAFVAYAEAMSGS